MKQIRITYTNHRNQTAERCILPIDIWYGTTDWHPDEQWFLKATDVERNVQRDFMMVNISNVQPAEPPEMLTSNHIISALPNTKGLLRKAKLFADGGSRGNPGPSASGYVILDMEDNVVKKEGIYIGITTNNQAEYQALEAGLRSALSLGVRELQVYLDSLLVVNQVGGTWKIKNAEFMPLYRSINELMKRFEEVKLTHVPRALNKLADAMVNECLDAR